MNNNPFSRAWSFAANRWPLLLALGGYSFLAWHLNFIQDDAYITYRYVANFLNGDGLVFNIGERIEGFTNFGWTIILAFFGTLGADFISVSKLLGFLFGSGLLVIIYLIATEIFEQHSRWYVAVALSLVGINQSLAYWAPAGLETAAFAFFALLSLYLYMKRSWLLIFTLVMAVWLRPEGAVVTGMLIIIEAVVERRLPRFTMTCAVIALLLSMPYVIFKISYYGSLLPNPFYAKTSFSMDQLWNGLEYTGRFFKHYGFYGAGLAVPLLFYRSFDKWSRALWWYTVIYLAYIVLIGGDALKVHRFFLPLFGPAAILLTLSLWQILKRVTPRWRHLVLLVLSLPLLGLSYNLPGSYVAYYHRQELALTDKMQFMARQMKETDASDFSVALSTIGVFSYELLGHEIIDMLGLTDSTIARHSEEPLPGMVTTWKEPRYNARYVLEKMPDYILFSTGTKPSAPAERALLLYRRFTESYRTVGWLYPNPHMPGRGVLLPAFHKQRNSGHEIVPEFTLEFVQAYKEVLESYDRGDLRQTLKIIDRARELSPEPGYIYLDYAHARCLMKMRQLDPAEAILESILQRDSTIYEAHRILFSLALARKDMEKADRHRHWLKKLIPWYVPRLDSLGKAHFGESRF